MGGPYKKEHNFVGGVWDSVMNRHMGVGGSLKRQKKRDVLYDA